jgi:hypothetical protein
MALAAGEAAGEALAGGADNLKYVQEDELSRIAEFTKQATADAGGSSREQNVAARNVIIRCAKATQKSYKSQQELADEHAGQSFSEVDPGDLKSKAIKAVMSSYSDHHRHAQSEKEKGATTKGGLKFSAAMQKARVSNVDEALALRPHDASLL